MTQLHYKSFGDGRPVIILHGLFGSGRNWQGIARAMAKSHHVITPDLRNHGNSPHVSSMSYRDMANDVMELINNLKLSDPVILGHSMGGKVAMTLALLEPTLPCGLVIVDIAPVAYEHDFRQLVAAMKSLSLSSISSRTGAEAALKQKLSSEKLTAFIMQNLERNSNGYGWRINLEQIAQSLPEIGQFPADLKDSHCRCPALFIGGAESAYISNRHKTAIFQHFPAAEIKMVKDAGHWMHVDKPREFLELVTGFIQCL
ncbi:MAG: alpha/beta fold hydrolase [Gammaproteobacteria bacterium]